MSTRAVAGEMPMAASMVQAFLRDVTGEFDVSDYRVAVLGPGQLLVLRPDEPDLHVSTEGAES